MIIKHKKTLLKYFITLTLFLSLWSLPGYAGKSQFQKRPASQNELFVHKSVKRKASVSYRKAFSRLNIKALKADLYKSHFEAAIRVHDVLTRVVFAHIAEKAYAFKPVSPFSHLKTIPQSSDEYILRVLRG